MTTQASTFAVSVSSAPSPLRRRRTFPVVRAQCKVHSKFLTFFIFCCVIDFDFDFLMAQLDFSWESLIF